ncbi:MAG: GNAT family N-acetyltransferase [Anaerolineae bacterium]|nr:GNAT family N-acetyltransferase [Anaerolineae bacterium]
MKLVPASQFTIQELTAAYNQTRVDYLVPMPMTARRLGEYIADYDVRLDASVVAMEKTRILGLCMLGLRGRNGWLTRLGVLPHSRRRGTGSAMVEYCIQQAVQRRAKTIYLEVIVGNAPALELFLNYGFQETHRLVVLRRPPAPPTPRKKNGQPELKMTWLSQEQTLAHARNRTEPQAWLNQVETFINSGTLKALELVDPEAELSGWVSYEQAPLQLKRVLVTLEDNAHNSMAGDLLYHLHTHFSTLDTLVENLPTDAPYLDAYYANGYVDAFSRIEMKLELNSKKTTKAATDQARTAQSADQTQ